MRARLWLRVLLAQEKIARERQRSKSGDLTEWKAKSWRLSPALHSKFLRSQFDGGFYSRHSSPTERGLRRMKRLKTVTQARIRSVRYAVRGLRVLLSEPNTKIHGVAIVAVVIAGAVFDVSRPEWALLVVAVVLVLVAEGLNTAVERLADAVIPERHPLIEQAKDVAAAAVLLAAVGSIAIAALVFLPRFLR